MRISIWLVSMAAVSIAVDYSETPLSKENMGVLGTVFLVSLVVSALQDIRELIRKD